MLEGYVCLSSSDPELQDVGPIIQLKLRFCRHYRALEDCIQEFIP